MNTKLHHEWDNDGCCIHCNFDGCESAHLRTHIHPDEREPSADYEVFCSVRKNIEPTLNIYDNLNDYQDYDYADWQDYEEK